MAIKMISNYSKRLGLPGYSSHQFSVSIETELVTTDDVAAESERLYQLLQSNVDQQIEQTGFIPPGTYGMDMSGVTPAANASPPASNGVNGTTGPLDGRWKCSDKQRDLIVKLVDEHQLDKHQIEALAIERFGHGVRLLDKIEASGLIEELLETHGGGSKRQNPGKRANGSAYHGANGVNGRRDAA